MILVIYGTTGELIKLAPVLLRLRDRGTSYLSATTGQHAEQIPSLLDAFGLPQPDFWFARGAAGADLRSNSDIPGWALTSTGGLLSSYTRLRRSLLEGAGRALVLVHGDTFTTCFGAFAGRLMRFPVAHLEAGLRSFNLRNPFPEELDRRITSKFASIHYAPGAWAASNLRSGIVVDTGGNTIRDSLALVSQPIDPSLPVPDEPFGLVSIHRFELLNDRRVLAETLEAIAAQSRKMPMLFIDHPVTESAIEGFGLTTLLAAPGIRRIPRLPFLTFVPLLRRSSFLFTDSGGNQEETFYLDIPCLVHRKATERREGLGENVVLSGYDFKVVRAFLHEPGRNRRREHLPSQSASQIVVDDLVARGFAVPTSRANLGSPS